MPYVYDCADDGTIKFLSTSASANTELTNFAFRQAVRNFEIAKMGCYGRGVAQTVLNGIIFRARRWTTVGTTGTSVTPAPRRRDQPAASTVVVCSSDAAVTQGTVSGAVQAVMSCGATGPGGWTARDDDAKIQVEAGSADEIAVNSITGGTVALPFNMDAEITE